MIVPLLATVLSLSAAFSPPPWGEGGASAGDDLEIGLVIFGPGHEVTGWFGHSALVVADRKLNQSRLYNYGEFSFDSLMLARYALGHLNFWVGERAVERTFNIYRRQGRTVRTLELALTPAERLAVARFLANNVRPENRGYLYDHFTDNCATKPRDVLDQVLGGKLKAASSAGRMTFREHTLRHTAVFLPLAWIIDFLLNDQVDGPITTWQETFLPAELEAQVRALGLIKGETINHAVGPLARDHAPLLWPGLLLIGLCAALLALAIALRTRSARALGAWTAMFALIAGIPGTALFVMWGFTDHFITYRNENILLSSPLLLLASPLGLAAALGNARAARLSRTLWSVLAVGVGVAVLVKLPGLRSIFDQVNAAQLALFVPAVLGTAFAWRLVRARPVAADPPVVEAQSA